MLRSLKDLENYEIGATDGAIGHINDFYFDDHSWVIRYFVVETGSWLSSRKVLISPILIHHPDWAKKLLPISITKQQVKDSPEIDIQKPVSRQHEFQYLRYYSYSYYWGGVGLWSSGMNPYAMSPGHMVAPTNHIEPKTFSNEIVARERALYQGEDSNLRSCEAMVGYSIHAIDGEVGHVAGLLANEETSAIRYIVIDTSDWWISHQVLIAPQVDHGCELGRSKYYGRSDARIREDSA